MPGTSTSLRVLYIGAGCVFVGLGALGAVLPLLPSTPFVLLALWCFSRSSQRLADWLQNHRLFGPTIHRWQHHRVVPLSVKLSAYGSMAASLALMIHAGRAPTIAIVATAVIMAIGVIYIWRCPSDLPPEATDQRSGLEPSPSPPVGSLTSFEGTRPSRSVEELRRASER